MIALLARPLQKIIATKALYNHTTVLGVQKVGFAIIIIVQMNVESLTKNPIALTLVLGVNLNSFAQVLILYCNATLAAFIQNPHALSDAMAAQKQNHHLF